MTFLVISFFGESKRVLLILIGFDFFFNLCVHPELKSSILLRYGDCSFVLLVSFEYNLSLLNIWQTPVVCVGGCGKIFYGLISSHTWSFWIEAFPFHNFDIYWLEVVILMVLFFIIFWMPLFGVTYVLITK